MEKTAYKLLETVNSPADLKKMSPEQANALASEIRSFLIENVTENGGHLASNLGCVELTLALHRVFDCPEDKIVFDVGHQCYVHKLITGRRDRFCELRRPGGLSGFTNRSESEYDAFGAGHSSTSLSAALGIARAEKLKGSGAWTVAVIGDGAFTGGMIHEAFNNCDDTDGLRLCIVLNENEMSISKNTGRFADALSKFRSRPKYFRSKERTKGFLSKIPLIGKPLVKSIIRNKKRLKNILYGSNYFEDLGLYYIGPIDGNDREKVEQMLLEAKKCGECAVIHVKTKKGLGYAPAEENPGAYHSVSPRGSEKKGGFSAAMGHELCLLAEKDLKICAITAAMCDGTGLAEFEKYYTNRFFDVGIAEEHAVTFAAGMASDGMRPFFGVYSSFLQRAYDNVIHDVALQNLPVVFCIDRAGLNPSDGATHHGIFDVAFLSSVPGMRIYTPATVPILRLCMREAAKADCPCAIRYPNWNGSDEIVRAFYADGEPVSPGVRFYRTEPQTDRVIVCHGRMALHALSVCDRLRAEGINAGVVLCEKIRPYAECAEKIAGGLPESVRGITFYEEEIRQGGFGMNMADALSRIRIFEKTDIIACDDSFAKPLHGQSVSEAAGVDEKTLENTVRAQLREV